MSAPRATMRLQFHRDFTFDAATKIVPYLAALGISHLYSSPILAARPGSQHGYDVVDPTRINEELGGEQGFRRLVAALRAADLGIILDIVPNHMAVDNTNRWWLDVLKFGQGSRYARYFDIDWEPENCTLRGKVLAPVLGRPYGEALDQGEIKLAFDAASDCFEARYFDRVFPLDPGHRAEIDQAGLAAFAPATSTGRERLHALLERQNFRLAWWRTANDEINWRRFFNINDLIGLRIEDDEVFQATHEKVFALFAEGLIDGCRIDHIDGLTDPAGYCRKLRNRLVKLSRSRPASLPAGNPYIVVEKILGAGEQLSSEWQCDGTSGYDFMNQVSAVLHDPAGEEPLGRLWHAVSGRPADFPAEEVSARRDMLSRSFAAQLAALVDALDRLARADLTTRDFTRAAIDRAAIEILVGMRVYRTYWTSGSSSDRSAPELAAAVGRARRTALRSDHAVVEALGRWLAGNTKADPGLLGSAIRRFQQLSAPLAAKAVEDTAFYRYGRLLSRVDVGFNPAQFSQSPAQFHQQSIDRLTLFPASLLATATHDHKRGEDVRARLAVLSEIAAEWGAALESWIAQSARGRVASGGAPSHGDLAILFQTMVGAWPPELDADDRDGCEEFCRRIVAWQLKALREAKLATDWAAPDEAYESEAGRFVEELFDTHSSTGLLKQIANFAKRIIRAGAVNSLTQALLKLTAPGVPDFYQGSEFWDFSLVDPDNRRPVDFTGRMTAISQAIPIRELAACWRDGRIKQALIRPALALRRDLPELFARGEYLPLHAEGPAADHVIAFARRNETATAITVATRLPTRLLGEGTTIEISATAWNGTKLALPAGISGMRNVFTNALCQEEAGFVPLEAALRDLPVALLLAPASSRRWSDSECLNRGA